MNKNNWNYIQAFDEYYDFEKELYSIPDEGNTSVDMRLTFNVETRTCYYTLMLRNDSGNTIDWEKERYISWDVGIATLGDEVEVPEELLSCAHE